MKIIFICGSLGLGHDGVGDYTRRLSGKLITMGYETQIVSICDHEVFSFIAENQLVEGTLVKVYRIPISTANNQRFIWLQNVLLDFDPDWISLQFVPYSFNPKGLPFWLPSFLNKLKGNHKWHIMFHELWLGIDVESSLKHKLIGKLQQLIVKKIIYNTKTKLINTQIKLYQYCLRSNNINAEILPICGNIPLTALKKEATGFTQFVLFGTIHKGAPFSDFVNDLMRISNSFNRPIKFVFIGKNSLELPSYKNILLKNNICYEVLGIQSENVISQVLLDSDFGISTTPYFQSEKSGVYAAYREHQLNTICVSRKWTPLVGKYDVPKIIKYEKNNLKIIPVDVEMFNLSTMAIQFINTISKL